MERGRPCSERCSAGWFREKTDCWDPYWPGKGDRRFGDLRIADNVALPTLEGLEFGTTTSAAEKLQTFAPRARLVKAFNTIGAPLLGYATFDGLQADGFYCSDHEAAKAAVVPLIEAAGLRPFDTGPLRNARYLEAMAMLWIDLAVKQGRGPTFGFRVLERTAS